MKTWILKSDLSHSPQAAFRTYACGVRRTKSTIPVVIDIQGETCSCLLISKIKSQLKVLFGALDQNPDPTISAETV